MFTEEENLRHILNKLCDNTNKRLTPFTVYNYNGEWGVLLDNEDIDSTAFKPCQGKFVGILDSYEDSMGCMIDLKNLSECLVTGHYPDRRMARLFSLMIK